LFARSRHHFVPTPRRRKPVPPDADKFF